MLAEIFEIIPLQLLKNKVLKKIGERKTKHSCSRGSLRLLSSS
jgi:hypothetical protein